MMAERQDEQKTEEPIHQAFWVFPIALFAAYGFLVIVMGAKWAADSVDMAGFFKVFGIQAVLLVVFLVLFGGLIFGINKLLGATDATE